MLNETCAVDLAEIGGDDATGRDCLVEIKVASSLTKAAKCKGRGSKKHGGKPASVGHLYAFGNTEERYRVDILGCKRRGRKTDKPMCHKTGKGFVEEQKGSYFDARARKKSRIIPFIVETLGGITPHAVAYVGQLARRAEGRGARDSTKYGTSRTSAQSYFRHHIQRIAMAATCCKAWRRECNL